MRRGLRGAAVLGLAVALAGPVPARAVSREFRTVFWTSVYCAGAGTVLGMASLPMTRDIRTMFMGTSIGLYLGIVLGIYFISNPDDPGNPLQSRHVPPSREGQPSWAYLTTAPAGTAALAPKAAPGPVLTFSVASF